MTGENAKTPVCHFPESLDLSALPPDVTSALCVVPRLFEQARWCTRTSPCSSSPRRRGSILAAKCRMMMDSRLRGNDGWICGNDCLFSACIVWVMSGVFGRSEEHTSELQSRGQ